MSREAVYIFSRGEAKEPQLINSFAAATFCAFKDFSTGSEGDYNTPSFSFFVKNENFMYYQVF